MNQRFRNFVFTINNPTEEDRLLIRSAIDEIQYIIMADEVGKEGTNHIQGYCELKRQMSGNVIKRIMPRAHIEKRRGTQKQAIEYCKKDGKFEELGEFKKQGKRTDIKKVKEIILEKNGNIDDVIEIATSYQAIRTAEVLLKYRKPIAKYIPKAIYWFHGPTGVGKTRKAMDMIGECTYWISGENLKWFDGYQGQLIALIDDFRKDFTTFHFLLRILDVYPLKVPVKGGFTDWIPKVIIITSCYSPTEVYNTREDIEQLTRRIQTICDFGNEQFDFEPYTLKDFQEEEELQNLELENPL